MANEIAEGMWPCTVISATAGEDRGALVVRVNVKIDDGPDKGKLTTYEDTVNEKSSLYIFRSLKAIGWNGPDPKTIETDVAAWVEKTKGKSTVEIRHIKIGKGAKYDKYLDNHAAWVRDGRPEGKEPQPPIWAKANSLGRGPKPLAAPAASTLTDAADAFRRAMEADGGSAPPMDDAPHSASSDVEDIPFITSTFVRDENGQVL